MSELFSVSQGQYCKLENGVLEKYMEKPFSMEKMKELIAETLKFPGAVSANQSVHMRKNGILYQVQSHEPPAGLVVRS